VDDQSETWRFGVETKGQLCKADEEDAAATRTKGIPVIAFEGENAACDSETRSSY